MKVNYKSSQPSTQTLLFTATGSGPLHWSLPASSGSGCDLALDSQVWLLFIIFLSVQFSSVTQSCLTLYNPMDCSTPGLPVHHQLPEFTQTHVHRVSDVIQPSHPLSSLSLPRFDRGNGIVKDEMREFPGGPLIRTLHFCCR